MEIKHDQNPNKYNKYLVKLSVLLELPDKSVGH